MFFRRTDRTTRQRRRNSSRLRAEQLESRWLLSTIQWINRGTPINDTDNFGDLWGAQAEVARGVVDAALTTWTDIISSFNYNAAHDTYQIQIRADLTGVGVDANARFTETIGGKPSEGTMRIGRGGDAPGSEDGKGDGVGWYLDPTPFDSSEFTTIVHPFLALPQAGSPAAGQTDLYSFVLHEMGHALGFMDTAEIRTYSTNTGQPDTVNPALPDGSRANLWVFRGPSVSHLLTAYDSGDGGTDWGGPVHTAGFGEQITFQGVVYSGVADVMTAFGNSGREQITDAVALILKDAYGYSLSRFRPNFHAQLNETTGELLIRGGPGVSDDSISIFDTGSGRLEVRVDLGNDTAGVGALPGPGNLPNFISEFDLSAISSIRINTGDGDDYVSVSISSVSLPIRINTGSGDDTVIVHSVGEQSVAPSSGSHRVEIRTDTGSDRIEVGRVGPNVVMEIYAGHDHEQDVIQIGLTDSRDPGDVLLDIQGIVDVWFEGSTTGAAVNSDRIVFLDTHRVELGSVGHQRGHVSYENGGQVSFINAAFSASRVPIEVQLESRRQATNNLFVVDSLPAREYFTYSITAPTQSVNTLRVSDLARVVGSKLFFQADGGRDDEVILFDSRMDSPVYYVIDETPGGSPGTARFRQGTSLINLSETLLEFRTVGAHTLHTAPAGSTVAVLSDDVNHEWMIQGGAGDDTVVFTPLQMFTLAGIPIPFGANLAEVQGFYTVRGGGGSNRIELVDLRASDPNRFIIDGYQIDFDELRPQRQIIHENVQSLQIHAGSGADIFDIPWLPNGVSATLLGNEGDDTFNIGAGDLFADFQADISIDGGAGTDRINLNDQVAAIRGGYVFGTETADDGVLETTFEKFSAFFVPFPIVYQSGMMNSRGIERIDLQGSAQGDFFDVNGTPAGMTYNLFGNDGADDFRINGSNLLSRINVRGGLPATAPGDRLSVYGTREDTGSYVPGSSSDNGRVTANGQIIDFTGLEPVYVEGFGSFSFVTPRSRDIIDITQYTDPADARLWTQIGGTSGLQNTPFEVLRVRDIGTLEVNLVGADFLPEAPFSIFDPDDRLTIAPFALAGDRVDLLRVIAGFGNDVISDRTLQGAPATTRLEIIAGAPNVRHEFWGTPYHVDLRTAPGGVAAMRAYDSVGGLLHDVRQINVNDAVFAYPLNQVSYSGQSVRTTLDEGEDGRQRFHTDQAPTRFHFGTVASGQFNMQLTGDSRVAVIAIIAMPQPPLLRGEAGTDSLTISLDSGLSLPAGSTPFVLEGFEPEDTITFVGLSQIGQIGQIGQGVPVETAFQVDASNAFGLVDPELLVELLVHLGPSVARFALPSGGAQSTYPKLAFTGHGFPGDSLDVKAPLNSGFTAIELLVREVNLAGIELLVAEAADRIRVSQDLLGGLRADATINGVSTLNLSTDESIGNMSLRTTTAEFAYPEPDFRAVTPVNFDTTRASELVVRPSYTEIIGVLIAQTLEPTFARTTVGNWGIDQNPYTSTTLVGTDTRTEITGNFLDDGRELNIRHVATGSTSTLLVGGARLNGLNFAVDGFEGAINQVAADIRNTVIEGGVQLSYQGPGAGANYLVTNVTGTTLGVGGSFETNIRTGGSPTTIADFSSNNTSTNTTPGGDWRTRLDTQGGPAVVFGGAAGNTSAIDLNAILIGLLRLRQDSAPTSIRIGLLTPNPDDPGFWQQNLQSTLDLLGSRTEMVGTLPSIAEPLGRDLNLRGTGDVLTVASHMTDGGTFIDPELFSGELLVVREGNVTVGAAPLLGTGIETELPVETLLVVNTFDTTPTGAAVEGSLRAAIEAANAMPDGSLVVIAFAIPESDSGFIDIDASRPGGDVDPDVFLIGLSTPLPALTRGNIVINVQSQQTTTGATNPFGPEITLFGPSEGGTALRMQSSQNHVHGFSIVAAAASGILIEGNGNVVTGSYIGVAPTGLVAAPNGLNGIHILNGDGNRIGGTRPGDRNVISANGVVGVLIEGNSFAWPAPGDPPIYTDNPDMFRFVGNTVVGNIIGLAADGKTPVGNGGTGFGAGVFVVHSANNVIDGNIVSGNRGNGITILGGHSNRIENNFIGTRADGMEPEGNNGQGIHLTDGTQRNRVIGNVVSGNHQNGIVVDGGRHRTQAEDFDSLLNTFFNGWTGFRNQENRDNFGYADGEAGGTFARASSALGETIDHVSYYADTNVGRFTLDDELRASGKLIFTDLNNFDGSVQIGYFNTDEAQANRVQSVLSLRVAEPNPRVGTTGIRVFAEIALANGTRVFGTPVNAGDGLELNVPYTWELYYNPGSGANRQGGLEVRVFAEGELVGTSFVSLTASHRTIGASFDAFGLHQGGESVRSTNPNTIALYVDNLRYTHVAEGQTIQGNIIGTNKLGTYPLQTVPRNWGSGIVLYNAAPTLIGGTSVSEGNVISHNAEGGIEIYGSGGHTVQGNLIGTTGDGMEWLGNQTGVLIMNSSGNMIGGSIPEARNVISGNMTGIWIFGLGQRADENHVAGNYVGLAADGLTAIGNGTGVMIGGVGNFAGGSGNIIGGTDPAFRNVISGNSQNNLWLMQSSGTIVQGNYIGTDFTGTRLPLGIVRGRAGIRVSNDVDSLIGGVEPEAGNVIVGHTWGIYLGIHMDDRYTPTGAHGTRIQGNSIGILPDGETRLANVWGVYVDGALISDGLAQSVTHTLIGGTHPDAGNLISGNQSAGIIVVGPGSQGIVIQGNLVGTDDEGKKAVGNGTGILLDTASDVQVGGTTENARNVISGNTSDGIRIVGGSGHVIEGNFIGTTDDGSAARPNSQAGISVSNSANLTIGGAHAGARNFISGNAGAGIHLDGPHTVHTQVVDNRIGTDRTGSFAIGNGSSGIWISGGASFTEVRNNLISGNKTFGVHIQDSTTTGNTLQGNLIGTNRDGTGIISNADGVGINLQSTGNLIGGSTEADRNVISGNTRFGIMMASSFSDPTRFNRIQGNYIGTDISGKQPVRNYNSGIALIGDHDTLIGGTEPGEGNLISGNRAAGIWMYGDVVNRHIRIQGNLIGTSADQSSSVPNHVGIEINSNSGYSVNDVLIGGETPASRNVIAGNRGSGIRVLGSATTALRIEGNAIGTNDFGSHGLGNRESGVYLYETRHVNVGGTLGNVISGNSRHGIHIVGGSGNLIQENLIGLDPSGQEAHGNAWNGIAISGTARDHQILDNMISANGRSGVLIEGAAASGNLLEGNRIGTDVTGELDRGNASMGVWIVQSPGNTVRENVISGNNVNGLVIAGVNASGNLAEGNLIGTDIYGTYAIGNVLGVHIADAPNNEVIGNLLSGNVAGLVISGATASGNLAANNLIGTTHNGHAPLPNTADGVFIDDAPGNTLRGNTISANGFRGVFIEGSGSSDNVLLENRIGISASVPAATATFSFADSLSEAAGGQPLESIGTGRFVTDTVLGTSQLVYQFDSGSGLRWDTTGILGSGSYSVELLFRFEDVASWQKIVDFENLTEDSGLYVYDGALQFYPQPSAGTFQAGVYHRVVLTRDATGHVAGYIDGVKAWQFDDAVDSSSISDIDNPDDMLHFFLDDDDTLFEEVSAGRVALMRIYDRSLTSAEVAGLEGLTPLGNQMDGIAIAGGAGSNTLVSNIISRNIQNGISILGGSGNIIQSNLIGLDPTGRQALGNGWNGIALTGAAKDHQILDNMISANGRSGVLIEGSAASGNLLEGNRIGTDSAGELDRGNGIMGVWIIGSPGNTVRENLISGNAGNGLVIAGVDAWGNRAERNLIGTDVTGTYAIGNVLGIHIADAPENMVIGNVLSGNVVGLDISGATANKNVVQGNSIGTTADGNGPLPNTADGIFIDGAPENLIGGLGQDKANVIGANGLRGIYIEKAGSFGNLVQGNRIGVGADGVTPLGNTRAGIEIAGGSDNRVLDNTIAYNQGSGVVVAGALASGNTIRRNAIHSNSGLGIDLGGDGVTPNDNGDLAAGVFPDADAGPNGLQNFPELQNVQRGVETRVNGLLRSTPGTSFVIDFYASIAPDPSGYGEGQRWLGTTTVVANSEGVARFSATLAATTYGGEFVSATATRLIPDGRESDTSEFSATFAVKAGKGERGPNSFTLEFLSASNADSMPLIASALDVQLVGMADLSGEFSPIDVATFTTAIFQSPEGPEGLPMTLAAHSSTMSPLLLDAVSRATQFGQVVLVGQTTVDGIPFEFARWTLDNVQIGSFANRDLTWDEFTLAYDRIEYVYTPQTFTGAPGTPVRGVWDVAASGAHIPISYPAPSEAPATSEGVKYLVKIPGITGDSKRQGYSGWIDSHSLSFSLLGPDVHLDTPGWASTISVLAAAGSASPLLMEAAAQGWKFSEPIEVVAIHEFTGGSNEFSRWNIEGGNLVSYATDSGRGDGFAIAFDTLHYSYTGTGPFGDPQLPTVASVNLAERGIELHAQHVDLDRLPLQQDDRQLLVRVPGVAGDSQLAGYADWIPVNAFRFSLERPLSPPGVEPVTYATSFSFVGPTGKASPRLFESAAHGDPLIEPVQVSLVSAQKKNVFESARWTLGGARIRDFATASAVLDGFTVRFDALRYEVTAQSSSGSSLPAVVGQWDLAADGSQMFGVPLALPEQLPLPSDQMLLVNLPGIVGSSTLAGYAGWIPVDSYRFEVVEPLEWQGNGAFASQFQFHTLASQASPEILRALLNGHTLDASQVVAVRRVSGSGVEEIARWTARNGQIVSYATENTWQDSFGLSFDALQYTYQFPSNKKGNMSQVSASWDLADTGSEVFVAPTASPQATLPADVRVLMQIPGVQGTSQLMGYRNWIELDSARVSAFRPPGGSEHPVFLSEYQLIAASGSHSPQVLEALAGQTMFGDGSGIQIVTVGQLQNGSTYEISRWTLGDSQITSYANQSLMQDGWSVAYDTLNMTYTPLTTRGTTAAPINVSWDLKATESFLHSSGPPQPSAKISSDVQFLLNIPGISGDSLRQGYTGWIDVRGLDWELYQSMSDPAWSGAASLVLELSSGVASPTLLEAAAGGLELPFVEVVALQSGQSIPFARLVLEGTWIAHFGTKDYQQDSLTLTYDRAAFIWNEFDPATGALLDTATGQWPAVTESNLLSLGGEQAYFPAGTGLVDLFDNDSQLEVDEYFERYRESAAVSTGDALDDTADPWASVLPGREQHLDSRRQLTKMIDQLMNDEDLNWLSDLEQGVNGERLLTAIGERKRVSSLFG